MTPDELRALADAATPGPWAYEMIDRGEAQVGLVWDDDDQPIAGQIGPDDGTVVEHVAEITNNRDAALIALAPVLARDHAALRDWAERAAEGIERAEYWAGKIVVPTERSPQREEWRALLSEWDAMKERP